MDIISAYREVGTYRGAAAICGTTPKTVRRVIARHEAGGAGPERGHGNATTTPVAELVADQDRRDARAGCRPSGCCRPAAAAGYEGSGRNFRRLVAEAEDRVAPDHHRGRRPAVWAPGEHLVIDWGVLGGLHVFCAVLAWSRVRFVRFAADERAATTLSLLAECFETLGGVPQGRPRRPDGLPASADIVADRVVPTPDYVRFASHYRFRPGLLRGQRPGVERDRGEPRRLRQVRPDDRLRTRRRRRGPHGESRSGGGERGCGPVVRRGQRARRTPRSRAVPAERLAARELDLLGGLPGLRPRIGGPAVFRKVDRLSCVRYGSARYSVPTTAIGTSVEVRVHAGELSVLTCSRSSRRSNCWPAISSSARRGLDPRRPLPSARPTVPARAVRAKTATEKAFWRSDRPLRRS